MQAIGLHCSIARSKGSRASPLKCTQSGYTASTPHPTDFQCYLFPMQGNEGTHQEVWAVWATFSNPFMVGCGSADLFTPARNTLHARQSGFPPTGETPGICCDTMCSVPSQAQRAAGSLGSSGKDVDGSQLQLSWEQLDAAPLGCLINLMRGRWSW